LEVKRGHVYFPPGPGASQRLMAGVMSGKKGVDPGEVVAGKK